jgi:hypothetical protein
MGGFIHRHLTNIDGFLGSFFYIRTVFRLNCLTAQPSYEERAAVEVVEVDERGIASGQREQRSTTVKRYV